MTPSRLWLIGALTVATCAAATAQVPQLTDGVARTYRIAEPTKQFKEYVGLDSYSGDILRWDKNDRDTKKWKFDWVIYPAPEFLPHKDAATPLRYRIQTTSQEEYLSVGATGGVVRWKWVNEDKPTQVFSFVNYSTTAGTFNIKEYTKGEQLGMGARAGFAYMVRWQPEKNGTQEFKLESAETATRPTPKIVGGLFSPATKLTGLADVPKPTAPELVNETILPYTEVKDPSYSDKYAQFKSRPYYALRQYRYWDYTNKRGWEKSVVPQATLSESYTVVSGFSNESVKSMERTVGYTISGSVTGTVDLKKGSVEATIGAEYSDTKKEFEEQRNANSQVITLTQNVEFEKGTYKIVCWKLVDRFELVPYQKGGVGYDWGKPISTWEHVNERSESFTVFPETAPKKPKSSTFTKKK